MACLGRPEKNTRPDQGIRARRQRISGDQTRVAVLKCATLLASRGLCTKFALMPKCFEPQSQRSSISGISSWPEALNEYVTFGGKVASAVLSMTPSRCSARSCAVRTFSLTPRKRLRNSANRRDLNERCHTACTFHLPLKTLIVACTGHP